MTTEYETIQYARDGAVGVITINRPDAMNSINGQMRIDLLQAIRDADGDKDASVIVLTGNGRSFCAGADLNDGISGERQVDKVLQNEYRPIIEAIAESNKAIIAAVNGSAAGIGLSIALSCDLLVIADDAFMLSPFTTISLVPDGGLNWLLVHQLGYRRAFQLSVQSERVPAAQCVELGLANRTAPADTLVADAIAWARAIAERAPLSVAATKKVMRRAASTDWASTFDLEAPLQKTLMASDDCAEGVAAFLEKRQPEFKGS